MTNHYCDMQNADVILTIGSNNVENHPVSSKWVQRALDNGATWIVVDPRYTRSAEMADIYCPIRSGTDIAFYGGLFNYILEHDLWQHEYVLNYTNASYLLDEEYSFDVETGIFSGFTSITAGMGGPPFLIYLAHSRMTVEVMRATCFVFFFLCNITSLTSYELGGLPIAPALGEFIYLLPALVLGILIGHAAFAYVPKALIRRLIFILLYITCIYTIASVLLRG